MPSGRTNNFPWKWAWPTSCDPTIFGIRSNISPKLLELKTSNLVGGFVLRMPSRRTNNFPENGRGLGHVTPTIFGSTVGYPSDSLASCLYLRRIVVCPAGPAANMKTVGSLTSQSSEAVVVAIMSQNLVVALINHLQLSSRPPLSSPTSAWPCWPGGGAACCVDAASLLQHVVTELVSERRVLS